MQQTSQAAAAASNTAQQSQAQHTHMQQLVTESGSDSSRCARSLGLTCPQQPGTLYGQKTVVRTPAHGNGQSIGQSAEDVLNLMARDQRERTKGEFDPRKK